MPSSTDKNKSSTQELDTLSKVELHQLADSLQSGKSGALEKCIEFILTDTQGLWHGRARAMMCRRLKHCQVSESQREKLVACIAGRLTSGNFSEQFYDQLRLAIHLDPDRFFEVARRSLSSTKPYVGKYAKWVLSHENYTCGR